MTSIFRGFLRAGLLPAILLAFAATGEAGIQAFRIATGFTIPLYVCAPAGDTGRIFVAEQHGMIKIVDLATNTVLPTPFLDLSATVGQGDGPGLLGMTFDPNYASNGYFYVSYSTDKHGVDNPAVSYVSRFKVSADPNVADRASEKVVIQVDQPDSDHNWDWIGFSQRPGDENNLYICAGDGGLTEDDADDPDFPDGYAQSTQTLLGKILRIHIEDDGSYTIPADNPFAGMSDHSQEIFCYGLRNPFRASFTPTGDLLLGDVGETAREEVDVQLGSNPSGGENYGWRIREGILQNKHFPDDPPPPGAVDPIFDYTHGETGSCVIGGYVYRGSATDLTGLYIFGDTFGPGTDSTGHVFTMTYANGTASNFQEITSQLFPTQVGNYTLGPLTSFGEDAAGELYLTDINGNLFKITYVGAPTPTPIPSPTPTPTPSPSPSQLGNISTRVSVGTGDNVMIGGFIITGFQSKDVIVRAIGPSLPLDGVLADPYLELHDSTGALVAKNDNWMDSTKKDAIIAAGIPPTKDLESAIYATLEPGNYTAIVQGVGGGTGAALAEVYDVGLSVDSKLANISTRGFVQTGDNVMIGGIIVLGEEEADIVVRAIGPSLTDLGVPGALADPMLELHDENGALLTSNDDWKDTQQSEIEAAELAPTDDRESAIFRTLSPGNYTAIVSGKDGATGIALVEAFNVISSP